MPAYFSIEVKFNKNILYATFVKDIYKLLEESGYPIKSGYWIDENMTYDKIISWNQRLLKKKFILGNSQHVKHDYKQMLLDTNDYLEMRVIWMYVNHRINLSIIIPECDVLFKEDRFLFDKNKILLADMVCKIWSTGLVSIIQSCLEHDNWVGVNELKKGVAPIIDPFCILDKKIYQRFDYSTKSNLKFDILDNNGVLIIDNSLLE